MGMFNLLKRRAKKPGRKTPAFRYEPSQNRSSLKNPQSKSAENSKMPDFSSDADVTKANKLDEEGYYDTKSLSTPIASENQTASKYKSVYENIRMDLGQRLQPPEWIMPTRFCEKDNLGIRMRSVIEAGSQKVKSGPFENEAQQTPEPYLRYLFSSAEDARDALLGLNFIHEAEDTGNLICTEPLYFGCYRLKNGKYEAYIGGRQLPLALWRAARESFTVHNGRIKNEQQPDAELNPDNEPGMTLAERVTRIREYSQLNSGQTEFYSIYEAPNAVIAQAFLKQKQNMVTKPDQYIVVKTPDGDFWRDIGGIYKK